MHAQAVAVANRKGGVGKTTLVANLAALAASWGWRTLVVDLDSQDNLGQDLGLEQRGASDGGAALHRAVVSDVDLVPVADVRPGLDVVPGGDVIDDLATDARNGIDVGEGLLRAVGSIADDYTLIVIDTPPKDQVLIDAALMCAGSVVVPTRIDDGSTRGLEKLAARFSRVRATTNPDLVLLGVVLFDVGVADTRMEAEARDELGAALAGIAPLFTPRIRSARLAARDMRREGQVAHEYAAGAEAGKRRRLRQLRANQRVEAAPAGNAVGLAQDYAAVTTQILKALRQRIDEKEGPR